MARNEVFSTDIKFDVSSVKEAIVQIEALRAVTLSAVKDIQNAIGSVGKIDLSGIGTDKITRAAKETAKQTEEATEDAAEAVKSLKQQFTDVGKVADLNNRSIGRSFRNLTDGFRLATKEGGNVALGLRTAFFGISDSSNVAARALDFFSKGMDEVNKTQDKFARFGARSAEEIANLSSVMRDQGKVVTALAKAHGAEARDLNLIRVRFAEVENAAEKANRRFLQGKDATATVLELETATRRLEEQIKTLRAQDILNDEELKELKELESILKTSRVATRQMAAAQRQMAEDVDRAKEEQKKQSKETDKGRKAIGKFADETKDASRNTETMERNVRGFNSSMQRTRVVANAARGALSSVFGGVFLGAFAGTVLPQILREARNLGTGLILLASEAEETQNRFDAVFGGKDGPLATSVTNSLEEIATNMRRSVIDLKTQASGFQDTFVPLKFSRDQAAEMSIALTALTQDLSSFYNVSTEEAARRLSSTLVGNTENMREFGVQINAAAIDNELLAIGIDATSRSANQQQKTMAILSLIYKGTKDAQGDVIRSQDEFANQSRALQATLKDLQAAAGRDLLKAITPFVGVLRGFIQNIGPQVIDVFNSIIGRFAPFAEAVSTALDAGNLESLMTLFNNALVNGINIAVDFLNNFIKYAFNWGANFAVEIANGLITTAADVIVDAMNFIGSIFEAFLKGTSPPKQGILSDIDKWGVGLMETFGSGFGAADFRFIEQALAPIKEAFVDIGGEAAFEGFSAIRDQLVGLTKELNITGEINEKTFSQIATAVGEGNEQLTRYLRLNLELQRAQKKLEDVESDITSARKAGFVPAELEERLALAQQEVEDAKEAVDFQQEFLNFQKLSADDFKKVTAGAISGAANAAKAATKSVKDAVNQQLEFIKEGYARERDLINEKFDFNAISHEDALKEMIRLEERFIEASIREGLLSEVPAHVKNLESLRERLDKITKKSGDKKGGTGIIPSVDDILGDYLTESGAIKGNVGQKIGNIGNELAIAISDNFKLTFNEQIPGAVSSISQTMADEFKKLGTRIAVSIRGEGTANTVLASLLSSAGIAVLVAKLNKQIALPIKLLLLPIKRLGVLISPLLNPIRRFGALLLSLLARFKPLFAPLTKFGLLLKKTGPAARFLLGPLGRLLPLLSRLLGPLSLAIIVFQNWNKIVRIFSVAIRIAGNLWQTFLDKFGGADAFFGEARDILDNISVSLSTVSTNVQEAIANLNSAQLVATLQGIFGDILSGDFNQALIEVRKFGGELFTELLAAMDFSGIDFEAIKTFLLKAIGAVGETITDVLEGLIGQENIDKLGGTFDKIAEAIGAPFAEGELAGELTLLFQDLGKLGKELLPILQKIGIVIGIGLGIALDVVISLFQALADVLPFVTDALAGVVRFARGLIIIFSGVARIVDSALQIIIGIFTGEDLTGAIDGLGEGFRLLGEGISTALGGVVQTALNTAGAVIGFVTSFLGNLFNNILRFLGPDAEAFGQRLIEIKDEVIASLGETLQGFTDDLVDFPGKMVGFFEGLPDSFRDIFGRVGQTLVELDQQFRRIITLLFLNILIKVIRFRTTILRRFATIVAGIVKKFTDLKTNVTDALSKFIPTKTLTTIKEGIIDPFAGAATDALAAIVGLGADILTELGAIDVAETLTTVKDSITAPFEGALTIASTALGDIATKAQTFLDSVEFGDKLDNLKATISGPFEGAKTAGVEALEGLRDFANGLFSKEVKIEEDEGGTVKDAIASVFTGAKADASPAITFLKDSLQTIKDFDLGTFINDLGTSFQSIDTLVAEHLQSAIDFVANFPQGIVDSLTEKQQEIETAITNISGAFSPILDNLGNIALAVVQLPQVIIDNLKSNPEVVGAINTVKTAFDDAKEGLANLGADIIGFPQKVIDNLKDNPEIIGAINTVSTAFDSINDALGNAALAISQLAGVIVTNLKDNPTIGPAIEEIETAFGNIETKVTEAVTSVTDLPGKIVTALAGKKPLIDAVIEPITSSFGGVETSVGNVASSVLSLPADIIAALQNATDVETAISDIGALFGNIGVQVKDALDKVIALPADIINALKEDPKVASVIFEIADKFDEIKTRVEDAIKNVQDLPGKIIEGLGSKKAELETAVTDFLSNFDSIPADILAFFTQAKDDLVAFLTGGFAAALVEAGKGLPGKVVEGITSVPGKIGEFFNFGDAGDIEQDFFGPVQAGATDTASAIVSSFEDTTIDENKGLFASLKEKGEGVYDFLFRKSIFPDMVNDIITLFQTEFPGIALVFDQLSARATISSITMTISWVRASSVIRNTFISATKEMIKITLELKKTSDETLKLMLDLWRKIVRKIREAIAETENLIATLEELAMVGLTDLVDAMDHMARAMRKTRDDAEEFAEFMEEARKEAEKIGDDLGGNFNPDEGGGGPGFQSGAFRIPRRMNAVLHQGEMVIPAVMAESLRTFLETLNQAGIGTRSFNIPIGQRVQSPGAQGGGLTTQTQIFNVEFPNVTDASNAKGIADTLQELLERGRSFSMVGNS